MNKIIPAIQQVNTFFEIFANALEKLDTKSMANMYNTPCTLLSNEATTVFNDSTKLEGFFNQGASAYKQFGLTHVHHEVWHKQNWSDKMVLVKVKWHYFDLLNNLIYSCDYQYIMKTDKNRQLKIVMSVSLNEKEKMEEWKKKLHFA